MKEYYNEGKLSLIFDEKKDGYWLGIGEMKHFIDTRSYKDFQNVQGLDLLDRFETYNLMIPYSLQKEKILASELEKMFSTVKEKERKEFEEFKKQNNL